jgi:hypothetical protein
MPRQPPNSDGGQWHLGALYVNKSDPRLVVSKRSGMPGWTFNFAHTGSWLLLAWVGVAGGVPSWYVLSTGQEPLIWAAVGVSAVLVLGALGLCWRVGRD